MPQIYCPNRTDVVFWFSYKAGSKWVERMFYDYTDIANHGHKVEICKGHWSSLNNPRHILFMRNPYKRVVSGFIFIYALSNFHRRVNYQDLWEIPEHKDALTFEMFVDILYNSKDWEDAVSKGVNDEHFCPQWLNANTYGKSILDLNIFDKVYDIENIDYNYIDSLFTNSINIDQLRNSRNNSNYGNYNGSKPAYKLNLLELFLMKNKPNWKLFFNSDIRFKFEQVYSNDFKLAAFHGLHYHNSFEERCE